MTTSDPAFYLAQRKELTLPEAVRSQWLGDALAHLVARTPKDLRRHVQRVLLHHAQGQGDALYAALIDLFIVLGAAGYALRERLFKASASLLSNDQQQFLVSHMDIGVLAGDMHLPAPRSRLSLGATGSFDFITRDSSQKRDERSPIEQANDYISYGQLDLAQATLEQALIENPNDDQVCVELIQLFQHTRDIEALSKLLTKLGDVAPTALSEFANTLMSAN